MKNIPLQTCTQLLSSSRLVTQCLVYIENGVWLRLTSRIPFLLRSLVLHLNSEAFLAEPCLIHVPSNSQSRERFHLSTGLREEKAVCRVNLCCTLEESGVLIVEIWTWSINRRNLYSVESGERNVHLAQLSVLLIWTHKFILHFSSGDTSVIPPCR